jgi:hypothetical protein
MVEKIQIPSIKSQTNKQIQISKFKTNHAKSLLGTPADYSLTYVPSTDFDYGQEVNVTVAAHDLAISP